MFKRDSTQEIVSVNRYITTPTMWFLSKISMGINILILVFSQNINNTVKYKF